MGAAQRAGLLLAVAVVGVVVGADPAGAQDNPSVTVTPSSGFEDGDVVKVSGTGFIPNLGAEILICSQQAIPDRNPPESFCDHSINVIVSTDASGAFAPVDFTIHRVITATNYDNRHIDCAEPPGCVLIVGAGPKVGLRSLVFGKKSAPVILLSARGEGTPDARTVVEGWGFRADPPVQLYECPNRPLHRSSLAGRCTRLKKSVEVRSDGELGPLALSLRGRLTRHAGSSSTDCSTAPGCVVVARQGRTLALQQIDQQLVRT